MNIGAGPASRDGALGLPYQLMFDHPVEFVRGEGAWLWDDDGRRYLDCYKIVVPVGHANDRVGAAVADRVRRLATHTRSLDSRMVEYADELVGTFPDPLDAVVLTTSGPDSNDLALRIARHVTGHRGVIVTEAAHHGNTVLTRACSPAIDPGVFEVEPWVRTVPAPGSDEGTVWADHVRVAAESLTAEGIGVAALLVDTAFGSDGVITDPQGFLAPALDVVRAAGGLMIADETQAGFGRLGGALWGFERHGVVPDLVTLGKAMGNGLPIGGVVGERRVIASFSSEMRYFNTFGGGQVAVAAGAAVLEEIRERGLVDHGTRLGERMRDGLRTIDSPLIGEVRGAGLFTGVDIIGPRREPDAVAATRMVEDLRNHGILVSTAALDGHILKIRPPLVIDDEGVDLFLEQMTKASEG